MDTTFCLNFGCLHPDNNLCDGGCCISSMEQQLTGHVQNLVYKLDCFHTNCVENVPIKRSDLYA
jgi:hypothetical protein